MMPVSKMSHFSQYASNPSGCTPVQEYTLFRGEDQSLDFEREILTENDLNVCDIPRGSRPNIFKAVSYCLQNSTNSHKNYVTICLNAFRESLQNKTLPKRLSFFYGNSQLCSDYQKDPKNSTFFLINLEFLSMALKVKFLLYSVNDLGYLQTITVGPKHERLVRLFRSRSDFFEPLLSKESESQPTNHEICAEINDEGSRPKSHSESFEELNREIMESALCEKLPKFDDKQSMTDSFPGSPNHRKNLKWPVVAKNNTSIDSHNTAPLINKELNKSVNGTAGDWGSQKKMGSAGTLLTQKKVASLFGIQNFGKNNEFEDGASICTILNTEDTLPDFDLSMYGGFQKDNAVSEKCLPKNPILTKIQEDFTPKYLMTSCRSEPSLPHTTSGENFNLYGQEIQNDYFPFGQQGNDASNQPIGPKAMATNFNTPGRSKFGQSLQMQRTSTPPLIKNEYSSQPNFSNSCNNISDYQTEAFFPHTGKMNSPSSHNNQALNFSQGGTNSPKNSSFATQYYQNSSMSQQQQLQQQQQQSQYLCSQQGAQSSSGFGMQNAYVPQQIGSPSAQSQQMLMYQQLQQLQHQHPQLNRNTSNGDQPRRKPQVIEESKARYFGTLKFFDEAKNYGFIVIDNDGSEIFAHYDDFIDKRISKDFLKTCRYGNFIRLSFQIMKYIGKYDQSRKAIEIAVL